MNERLTQAEIKYRNKLKLNSIEKRIEALSSAIDDIEQIVDDLYTTTVLYNMPSIVDDLDKTILRPNDVLGG